MVEMVRGVRELGMEACVTLGMLNAAPGGAAGRGRAHRLQPQSRHQPGILREIIVTTRITTTGSKHLRARAEGRHARFAAAASSAWARSVRDRGIHAANLATMNPHPESVPINALVAGQRHAARAKRTIDPLDFVRMVAIARIVMPDARVRLSAGRAEF